MLERLNINPFENLPIEFKVLNNSDFDGYVDEGKTIIQPIGGFISHELGELLDLQSHDTTIINAAVGQGKTTAIINIIEKYYRMNTEEGKNYVIIVACPFKALVSQYKEKITEASNLDNICFDYRDLENPQLTKDSFSNFHKYPIQLVTINSILGNPGQVAMKQMNLKRKYYESLIKYCKKNGKQAVFIFDEIHEAIHNFSEEFVFNLFKWRDVTHKIIVASATFTESSKVVIKYFAELTEKKIKIFESKWEQVEERRLSELNLCLYNSYTYEAGDKVITDLIEGQIQNSNKIHILTYSKKLAKNLYNSELSKKIADKFGSVNLCVGDNSNSFDPESCNIGTTFKTGVSIEDEGCSFFIIMPPNFAYSNNKNSFGIFSSGIFNITQAIARTRKKSKIFIIMPSPDKIILTPEIPLDYIKKTSLGYLNFESTDYQAPYINLNNQNSLLLNFYNNIKQNVKNEIEYTKNTDLNIAPNFPAYDMYKLLKGEKFFQLYYEIFGKNLSNYIYWAAWNNQFANCKLKGIIKPGTVKFKEGSTQQGLDDYYYKVYFNDSFFTLNSDLDCYNEFRNSIFSNTVLYKKTGQSYAKILPNRNSTFERQIITFIQRKKRQHNFNFKNLVYSQNGFPFVKIGARIIKKKPKDIDINMEEYLQLNIQHSLNSENALADNLLNYELINSYKLLASYKDILLNEYSIISSKGIIHLPIDSKMIFTQEHKFELNAIIENIKKNDTAINDFSFLQKRKSDNMKPVYKLLRDLFFETSETTINVETKKIKALKIISHIEPFDPHYFINLVYNFRDPWLIQVGYGEVESEKSDNPFFVNDL